MLVPLPPPETAGGPVPAVCRREGRRGQARGCLTRAPAAPDRTSCRAREITDHKRIKADLTHRWSTRNDRLMTVSTPCTSAFAKRYKDRRER